MDKKDYFNSIRILFNETNGINLDRNQELINDSESDVNKNFPNDINMTPDPEEIFQSKEEAVPDEGMTDADYLLQGGGEIPSMEEPLEVSEKQKLLKLFSLFKTLLTYGEVFLESLEKISIDMIDEEKIKEIKIYKDQLKKLTEKIRDYLKEIFVSEKYEKSLYAYILMRTELLSLVKMLREILLINEENPKEK